VPYFCIQNAEDKASNVKITYMKGDGSTQVETLTVPPRSRQTVTVGDEYQGTRLSDAYERNLASFFTECLYYQTMAATCVCNALDYKYHGNPNMDAQAWMQGTYLPQMRRQADVFVSCVEQLVMSQAQMSNAWGSNTSITLPAESAQILASADLLRRVALGQVPTSADTGSTTIPAGICGRIISTQDLIPAGSKPPDLYAQKQGTSTKVKQSFSENKSVGWVDTSGASQSYDCWAASGTTTTLSFNNNWSMLRYNFDNVGPGTYDIVDGSGKKWSTATVTSTDFDDPVTAGQTDHLTYGYWLTPQRYTLVTDPKKWTGSQTESKNYTDDGDSPQAPYINTDPANGKTGHYTWIKDGHGTYSSTATIQTVNFTPAADMNVYGYYNLTATRCKDAGPNYSDYAHGYIYAHFGWYKDYAKATGSNSLEFQDVSTGSPLQLIGQSKSEKCDSGHYTQDAQFSSQNGKSPMVTLSKGKTYRLCLVTGGSLNVDNGQACFNHKLAIVELRLSNK
jgi:hypothetical protein